MPSVVQTSAILSVIALISIFSVSDGAVIGLDFGSEFLKISSISPGKSFQIVENTSTKRKTENAISFYDNDRLYESAAILKKSKAYNNTFTFMNKYIGVLHDDTAYLDLSKMYLEDYTFLKSDKGTLAFGLGAFEIGNSRGRDEDDDDDDDVHETDESTESTEEKKEGEEDKEIEHVKKEKKVKEQVVVSLEEIMAMILRHVKVLSENQAGVPIKDISVTVPPHWAFKERYALHNAAVLAGFNPLSFISENTAGALFYGLERFDENKTHTVVFFNMGSQSTKVSMVEFTVETSFDKTEKNKKYESIRVLADTWDNNLGGYELDVNMAKHLASEFDKQPSRKGKASVLTSNSAIAKLIKQSTQVKETLSANKQAGIYMENLFDNTDFKLQVERATFEQVNQPLFAKITGLIDEVLKKAGKTKEDIDALEVLGAGVRVPKVTQILSEYWGGKDVAAHINGDEAMAHGAAFYAANLSSSFKARTIYLSDGHNFDIGIHIVDKVQKELPDGEAQFLKHAIIFPQKTRYGTKRVISFTHDQDVVVTFYYNNTEGEKQIISSFDITGLNETSKYRGENRNSTDPKLHLHISLNPMGFIEMLHAEATLEETTWVEEVVARPAVKSAKKGFGKKKANNSTNTTETDSAADNNSTKVESDNASESNTTESDSTTSSDDNNTTEDSQKSSETQDSNDSTSTESAEESNNTTETESSSKNLKRRLTTHTVELSQKKWVPEPNFFTEEELSELSFKLKRFDLHEAYLKKKAEAKSNLESQIYTLKELVDDSEFSQYTQEAELTKLTGLLSNYSEWLWSDEVEDASLEDFTHRNHKLSVLIKPINFRMEQQRQIWSVIEEARINLEGYPKKVDELNKTKPWIKETAKAVFLKANEKVSQWIEEMASDQLLLEKNQDVVITTTQVLNKMQDLLEKYNTLKNTPKPKEDAAETPFKPKKGFNLDGFKNKQNSFYEIWRKNFDMGPEATDEEILAKWLELSEETKKRDAALAEEKRKAEEAAGITGENTGDAGAASTEGSSTTGETSTEVKKNEDL